MGGEIVTLHIGQAGVQISHALWELVCVEHGITCSGQKTIEPSELTDCETGREYVFREVLRDKFVPRALLVDLEPSVIDEVRQGAYRELWHPLQLISGKEDAASNFARGYYSQSRFEMSDVMDRVRILVEQCDNMACFKLLYSANGGTGSGLTSALCERLSDEYGKKRKFATTVYPSPGYSELMVEPYNALFHSSTNLMFCDCVVITDNEAMLNVVEDGLRLHHAGFTVPNRVIANAITTQFLSHRYTFIGQQHSHVDELLINLIPYPRIHFPMMAFAPFFGPACHEFERSNAVELVRSVFEDMNQLLSVSAVRRAYISCALLFRGAITPIEAINAVSVIKADRLSRARFVDWCPTGFKIGVNFAPPIQATEHNTVALKNTSLSMIAGISKRFDQLYEKRAYVHWYVAEGMEEGEFALARDVIQQLVEDYEAIAKDAEGAVYDSSMNHSQDQLSRSVVRTLPSAKRGSLNRNDMIVNQATTLDDPNSLHTLENNEDNMSFDTNQHHSQSLNASIAHRTRLRALDGNGIRNEWGTSGVSGRGSTLVRLHPTRRRRLHFPLGAYQTPTSSGYRAEMAQHSSNALLDTADFVPVYGTNCSAAVGQRNPDMPCDSSTHQKPSVKLDRVASLTKYNVSTRPPDHGCLSVNRPASTVRSAHYPRESSGIPRFIGHGYVRDVFRKISEVNQLNCNGDNWNCHSTEDVTPAALAYLASERKETELIGPTQTPDQQVYQNRNELSRSDGTDNLTDCLSQSTNHMSLMTNDPANRVKHSHCALEHQDTIHHTLHHANSLDGIPDVKNVSEPTEDACIVYPSGSNVQKSTSPETPLGVTPLVSTFGATSPPSECMSGISCPHSCDTTETRQPTCCIHKHQRHRCHRSSRHKTNHCEARKIRKRTRRLCDCDYEGEPDAHVLHNNSEGIHQSGSSRTRPSSSHTPLDQIHPSCTLDTQESRPSVQQATISGIGGVKYEAQSGTLEESDKSHLSGLPFAPSPSVKPIVSNRSTVGEYQGDRFHSLVPAILLTNNTEPKPITRNSESEQANATSSQFSSNNLNQAACTGQFRSTAVINLRNPGDLVHRELSRPLSRL
ncbi:unnamed protein product [Dicrocoelium dendriticum]|nr:unnamed protein product [Dicrocoelium dendriticum]